MATQANFYPNLKQCACPDRWYTHVLGLFLFSGWAVPLMAGGAPWSLAVGALWLVGYIAVCMNAYDERGLYTILHTQMGFLLVPHRGYGGRSRSVDSKRKRPH